MEELWRRRGWRLLFFHELCDVYVYNVSWACTLSRMEGQWRRRIGVINVV